MAPNPVTSVLRRRKPGCRSAGRGVCGRGGGGRAAAADSETRGPPATTGGWRKQGGAPLEPQQGQGFRTPGLQVMREHICRFQPPVCGARWGPRTHRQSGLDSKLHATGCVTSGNWLNLSEHQSPGQSKGEAALPAAGHEDGTRCLVGGRRGWTPWLSASPLSWLGGATLVLGTTCEGNRVSRGFLRPLCCAAAPKVPRGPVKPSESRQEKSCPTISPGSGLSPGCGSGLRSGRGASGPQPECPSGF